MFVLPESGPAGGFSHPLSKIHFNHLGSWTAQFFYELAWNLDPSLSILSVSNHTFSLISREDIVFKLLSVLPLPFFSSTCLGLGLIPGFIWAMKSCSLTRATFMLAWSVIITNFNKGQRNQEQSLQQQTSPNSVWKISLLTEKNVEGNHKEVIRKT